ncbi:MAG TPA: hypothetical protein VMU36_06750 [Spirochaetia bacterium]|nr:hypothetical protein [Spirochaetia bacterium]
MSAQDILKKLPPGGFLKTTQGSNARISKEQRAALIRRGNELFNKGEFGLAQRIFITTKYSDGLIRIGDHFAEGGKPLEALRAYWVAPCPEKAAVLIERIAKVMKEWLSEERKAGTA